MFIISYWILLLNVYKNWVDSTSYRTSGSVTLSTVNPTQTDTGFILAYFSTGYGTFSPHTL
jgi:hypothetical protein